MTDVTETEERQLWEELNRLLTEAVPPGSSPEEAERSQVLAAMGHDREVHDLYEQVRKLARTRAGYLRDRLDEENPVSTIRQRLRLSVEAGQQA